MLEDYLRPTVDMFIQVSKDTRVKLDVLPLWEPYLQMTFADEAGVNRTIRLKLNCNTPYQDEQIEKFKIPANAPFTRQERLARKFINGVNVTNNLAVQAYLEAYPAFRGFKGTCSEITGPAYRLFDAAVIIKSENKLFKDRLKAANKIAKLELKEAQDMLITIYGVSHVPSEDLELVQNQLVAFMDEAEEEGIAIINREDQNLDDETTILIGRLISTGILSFDAVPGQVAKKGKDGKWLNLKAISNDYSDFERQRYFSEFITAPDGKLLMQDLQNELNKPKKKAAAAA